MKTDFYGTLPAYQSFSSSPFFFFLGIKGPPINRAFVLFCLPSFDGTRIKHERRNAYSLSTYSHKFTMRGPWPWAAWACGLHMYVCILAFIHDESMQYCLQLCVLAYNTGPPDRMSHRKYRLTKQRPSRARAGYQISCCLLSLHFLCDILSGGPVHIFHLYIQVH